MNKGFLFSIDTLLSLLLALVVLVGFFSMISRESSLNFGAQDLAHYSLGTLKTLDANNSLQLAFSQNKSAFFYELLNNATQRNICMNLTFFNETKGISQNYVKRNCTRPSSSAVATRPYFYSNKTYIINLESWYS